MSLAWLRSHARNRDRGNSRSRSTASASPRSAHRQFAGAEAVTSRDANWLTDEQYKRQYLRLGWEVAPIRKDGNCLFRALSDQLYGHERRHLELRRRLVDFIDLERAFFEPFVAGEGVVEYCERLREAGAWGGHPELVAASRLLGVNIIVHTGPVKRLRIDTDKYALTKEAQGPAGGAVRAREDPVSKPTSSPVSKKATVNTATPAKPTSATVLDVEVEEPEAVSVKPRNAGVHLPRRAVFNGGRRRRSSAAALALMQEVSASLNAPEPVVVAPPAPAPVPSPPAPSATRSVAIKKSSKKVFHQGRPVSAAC
ncbi:OTU ovarian tumor-like cysteine protease [Phytophthora cinnamomi]|uniref:OTU ovarian tumor-like cysteine protease n=1 Tax=Phytophthora cinnamomi TaxID=4785 RepID=UPI00355A6EC2|nr:OTU ovarian tumor-like cysteine protease [Phytophthora cinnamomi]